MSNSCVCFSLLTVAVLFPCVQSFSCEYNTRNLSRNRRQTSSGITCELPEHPKNGRWTVLKGEGRPGDHITKDTVVKFECNPEYKLSAVPILPCDSNWSVSNVPICEKKCSPKYSTHTTILKCEDKYGKKVNCDEAVDGTYLSYSCVPFYEAPLGYKKTILCVDGTWNFPNPFCQPVCGKKIGNNVIKLIGGGTVKEKREYPWIVAIFKKSENDVNNICGGSLLSQRVVVTAAHCVSNDFGEGLPPNGFIVGAGKYYRRFQDSRDVNVQYVEVARIVVNSAYRGADQRFFADIALLITKDLIIFNEIVQPVCYQDLPSIHTQAGKIGVVAAWGRNEKGEKPDVLTTLEIPHKYQETCVMELPPNWADKFYTTDKICAGYLKQNKSLCDGDSGSGLYFKNPDDNRYYIHGVVSIAPTTDGECNLQQNSLYTNVANYYEFIDRKTTMQYVEQCPLPSYPKNGKWTVLSQDRRPGDIVPSTTVLKIECNQGYELSSGSAFIDCETAHAMPTCEILCPKLQLPVGTSYKCNNNKGEEIDCEKAVHGSILTYFCPDGYKLPSNGNRVKFCKEGSWGRPNPECVPSNDSDKKEIDIGERKIVVCTYASWYAYEGVLPEDFNTTLCTHLVYAYMGISENGNIRVKEFDGKLKGLFRRFTDLKQKNKDLKVLWNIGGSELTNSSLFSNMANDDGKKEAFINSALNFTEIYNFDGINLEWQFPALNDKKNYMSLLRDLKSKCQQKGWLLTASVLFNPENTGYDGRAMAELLDWVTILTYDFYGPWSTHTGQNSPLYLSAAENTWEKTHLNIDAAANNWVRFGVPTSKMVLSIAFYSWSFILADKSKHGVHAPVTMVSPNMHNSFLMRYSKICMDKRWMTVWDDEQKSAYSYYEDKWVGHENKDSAWIKGDYIRQNGFLGVHVWPMDGDDVHGKCGSKQILLKHVIGGLNNNSAFVHE